MLEVDHISKKFGSFALDRVTFRVGKGDYFILLGESGAGKSLVLETIAGLVKQDEGMIFLEGHDISGKKIQQREIGLVFQDHAVFPHLKVGENIAFSLHGKGFSREQRREKVSEIAQKLSISDLLHRRPASLSGGELQRVALARTLIQQPRVLLLDEPLASLDSRIKTGLRSLLRSIHRSGQTIVHVTHDYEEALSLGTRIAVIDRGKILQEGTPDQVFHHPGSEFVAHFAGIRNFYPVRLVHEEGRRFAVLSGSVRFCLITDDAANNGHVIIRGEDIVLSKEPVDTSMTNNFRGIVKEVALSRSGTEVTVDIGVPVHALITTQSQSRMELTEGSRIWIHFKATAVKFLPL